MCHDKETSLKTYVIGVILSLCLFYNGDKYDKHIAIFSFVFIQMQLVEYFMWSDQDCGKINHYASISSHILLMLQPLAVLIPTFIFNTLLISKIYLYILLILLTLPLIRIINMYKNMQKKLCSKEKETGHLEWEFINGNTEDSPRYTIVYLFILVFTWLFFKNKRKGIISTLIILISFVYSKFDINNISLSFKQWESKWCFTGIIFPFIFVMNKYLKI